MKIFEILDPFDYTFAQAGLRGTWEEGSGLCPECKSCGTKDYRVEGLEKYVPARDLRTGELSPRRIPRVPGAGIFLRSRDLGGASIFGVSQLRGPTLCTEQVKAFIEEQQYTNVTFVEVGDVI